MTDTTPDIETAAETIPSADSVADLGADENMSIAAGVHQVSPATSLVSQPGDTLDAANDKNESANSNASSYEQPIHADNSQHGDACGCHHDAPASAPPIPPTNRPSTAMVVREPEELIFMGAPPPPRNPALARTLKRLEAREAEFSAVAVEARSLRITSDEIVGNGESYKMLTGDEITADDERYSLPRSAFPTISAAVGAPASYLQGLSGGLQQRLFSHHLELTFGEREVVYLITRGGAAIGLRDPKLVALPASAVLKAAADTVGSVGEFDLHDLAWTSPTTVEFELLLPAVTTEVQVGDIVRAGVKVTHSIDGQHASWVSAFVYRLVCANGLTTRQCVSTRDKDGKRRLGPRTRRLPASHPQARELQLQQVQRLVAGELSTLDEKLGHLKTLPREHANVQGLLAGFLQRAHLPRGLLSALLAAWVDDGKADTRWAAVNALTNLATHDTSLSPRVRRALAALGGIVAYEARHVCPSCFANLGGMS